MVRSTVELIEQSAYAYAPAGRNIIASMFADTVSEMPPSQTDGYCCSSLLQLLSFENL